MSNQASTAIREITDEEVAFYQRNGWVKLDRLIEPELAAELLRIGGPRTQDESSLDPGLRFWKNAFGLAKDDVEPFRSLSCGETMGRNAQRLMNRKRLAADDVAVRYLNDLVVCKRAEDVATHFHQDQNGLDRLGSLMFWFALDEVTPEMGAMRFLSGAHREGPLGFVPREGDILDLYPKLLDLYEWSPPLHYLPGDATVHHGCMIHGTPPNATDRPRWAYIVAYSAADALRRDNAFDFLPFDDVENPVVFARAER
jgi:hypothetical protein